MFILHNFQSILYNRFQNFFYRKTTIDFIYTSMITTSEYKIFFEGKR